MTGDPTPAQRGGVVMTAEQCERAVMVKHWGMTQCPHPAVITEPRPVCRKHLDEMRLRARLNGES